MSIRQTLSLKTFTQAGKVAVLALAFTFAPLFAATASAGGGTQVIHVSGTFETTTMTDLCDGIDDCVVDSLSGSFEGGTNRLITVDFVETQNRIIFEDQSRVDTNGFGVFEGTEIGVINTNTEEFRSVSVTTSTDGCGSKLILRFTGTIDLDSPGLENEGTYKGVLIKKTC